MQKRLYFLPTEQSIAGAGFGLGQKAAILGKRSARALTGGAESRPSLSLRVVGFAAEDGPGRRWLSFAIDLERRRVHKADHRNHVRVKGGGPGRIRTCDYTVMSGAFYR